MALIAPALISADFARLGEALEIVKSAGASMVHIDVMDGHFAPEIAMGQPVVASIRRATDLVLEVHLMVERPERYAAEFLEIGADRVSIHPEATPHLSRMLGLIRKRGAKAGLALNPATPVGLLSEVWDQIDFLTILSRDPGGTEQALISRTGSKVRAASRTRQEQRLDFAIEVEGGVNLENLQELVRSGADILVVGSAIFDNDDPKACLTEMVRRASGARQTSRV
jgi:ribulose-phosphate 3-epimerase